MDKILAGVARFQFEVFPSERALFADLASEQHPRALFITCSDSRVLPNLITQTDPGELFICRIMGGLVPAHGHLGGVSATVEYAVAVLGVRHVIVCAHSDCGVLRVLMDPESVRDLPSVAPWLTHGEAARRIVVENHAEAPRSEQAELLTRYHVAAQLANLRTHPAVAVAAARGALSLHGWHYDIAAGLVSVLDETTGEFRPAVDERSGAPAPDLGSTLAR